RAAPPKAALGSRRPSLRGSARSRWLQPTARGAKKVTRSTTSTPFPTHAIPVREQAEALERQSAQLQLSTRRLEEAHRVARLGYWEIESATGDVYWSDEMYRIAGLEVGTLPVPTD